MTRLSQPFLRCSPTHLVHREIIQRAIVCFSHFFRPKSSNNKLVKYADDTNLLVPENTNCTLLEEFEHVKDWARANKLVINMSKTKELVFHKPRPTRFQMPEVVDNIGVCVLEDMIRPTSCPYVSGWWRGTVVERRSLAGELSLSCA